jgi:uncharacterized phage protein (TIGR01671 family)
MRQIKFRAWDINKKEMYYLANSQISEVHLVANNKYWSIWDGKKRICGNADKTGILEQFMGLKGKNGVEIYEGDIAQDVDWGQQKRAKGQVVYQRFEFVIKKNPKNKSWWNLTCLASGDIDNLEIIGNIHENPELIK